MYLCLLRYNFNTTHGKHLHFIKFGIKKKLSNQMTKVDQTILSETAGMFSLKIMELSKTNIGIYRYYEKCLIHFNFSQTINTDMRSIEARYWHKLSTFLSNWQAVSVTLEKEQTFFFSILQFYLPHCNNCQLIIKNLWKFSKIWILLSAKLRLHDVLHICWFENEREITTFFVFCRSVMSR